ncbi:hypothetical protein CBR_g19314 [Chara braunii]|uniref:Protein kinase domain-containing protein n=1 Tax=Chara braunii TaxID=69332 RepID=A0A388KXU5_CHABU|nr:hypothetical protein CBR_g19314 [Chara braunii]|eukprot:GBG74802.1 hypothetical protein CBR_g19314 [Chara braunii]
MANTPASVTMNYATHGSAFDFALLALLLLLIVLVTVSGVIGIFICCKRAKTVNGTSHAGHAGGRQLYGGLRYPGPIGPIGPYGGGLHALSEREAQLRAAHLGSGTIVPMRPSPDETMSGYIEIPRVLGGLYQFKIEDLEGATGGFAASNLLGRPKKESTMYKGVLPNERVVAIKMFHNRHSTEGHMPLDKFRQELAILSKLYHRNLVNLIGFCSDEIAQALVYDFLPHGMLRDHLKGKKYSPLSWHGRLQVLLGVAQALEYMHSFVDPAVPAPLMEDGVAVVDLREYIVKIDREYATQRYDDTGAPLLYVRIQIGKATCSAFIDCGATRNYISQDFMTRAGLGPRVRRKSQPTQVTLADGCTHKSIERCIDSVPMYVAPLAREAMSFDILDTKFDIILGMSWLRSEDHPVNFYRHTVHVRDRNGVLVPCTVPPPHPSIGCHVVSAASIRNSIARNDVEEMGICFSHALPPPDEPAAEQPPDPRIVQLLDSYGDVFEAPAGIVPNRPIPHEIILKDGAVPPRGCIYRMSEEELEVLRTQLDDLIDKGWIRPSCSPHGAPVLFVRKKNKELHLCIDYRKLNAQTIKNVGPLPPIDDLLERLGGAKYFSKLDFKSGYHQLEIHPRDRYKTAFKTRYRHFEWVVMLFGLTNAPTTFQAAMTMEFRDMLDWFVLIYLDGILVYSRTLDEHIVHLRAALDRLRTTKYKANRAKCEFAQQELEYLGHFVTPQGISPLADKIKAIQDWSEPANTTEVRSFMGLVEYYQCFIGGDARIAAPLSRLQSPQVPFQFTDEVRSSFHKLKTALLLAPVLSIYDPTLPTRVTTDASGYGMGAVLEQHDGVNWHPVEYFSQKVPPINSVDDTWKELLAFVTVLKRWRHFLLGRQRFTWVMDNNPLTYYKTQDTVSSTIARWMYFIDQFDFTPKHISGLSNRVADALSRRSDLCALTHHAFSFDEALHQHFVRAYKSDPEYGTLYEQLSSDHPPTSHYHIVDGYLLLHSRGKDLLCVPHDRRLRTRTPRRVPRLETRRPPQSQPYDRKTSAAIPVA